MKGVDLEMTSHNKHKQRCIETYRKYVILLLATLVIERHNKSLKTDYYIELTEND